MVFLRAQQLGVLKKKQAVSLCINLYTSSLRRQKGCLEMLPRFGNPAIVVPHGSVTQITFNGWGRLLCVGVSVVCLLPDTQADQSDCQPDGPWCGWLDQVEPFQTTHSGWHKLWGLSVLGGRGSMGTIETLESNKLIRRETDTPVHYRVTETEGTERNKRKEEWLLEYIEIRKYKLRRVETEMLNYRGSQNRLR